MASLIAFEATACLGSMTAAAAEESTTQPAISQRIRALEEQLGLPLFDRKGGRLTLTAPGERFYDEIAPSLEQILKSCERLKRDGNQPAPSIIIAAGSGFTHLRLLPRLAALKKAFPGYPFEQYPLTAPMLRSFKRQIFRFASVLTHEGPRPLDCQ